MLVEDGRKLYLFVFRSFALSKASRFSKQHAGWALSQLRECTSTISFFLWRFFRNRNFDIYIYTVYTVYTHRYPDLLGSLYIWNKGSNYLILGNQLDPELEDQGRSCNSLSKVFPFWRALDWFFSSSLKSCINIFPKTNIAPENGPSQKALSFSNHPFSGATVC